MGDKDIEHNGLYVSLFKPLKTSFGLVNKLRVRQPDPYRLQVGCGDFVVDDYEDFKKIFLNKADGFIREIERTDMTFIEFWHPDFDTLSYIVKE